MADVAWTKQQLSNNVDCYSATLTSTDTSSALLPLDPAARTVTVLLNVGSGESCNLQVSNSAAGANLQTVKSAINANYDDRFDGGITGLKIVGTIASNTIVCRILQVK